LIVDFIVETPFLFIIFFHDKTDYIVIFLLRGFFILLFWFAIYIRTTMLLLILSDWILIFLIFHQPLIIIIRLSLFFYITSQNIGETDVATERSLKKVVCRTDALVANSIVSKISQLSICFFFQNFESLYWYHQWFNAKVSFLTLIEKFRLVLISWLLIVYLAAFSILSYFIFIW
jgi:hypothetical protein